MWLGDLPVDWCNALPFHFALVLLHPDSGSRRKVTGCPLHKAKTLFLCDPASHIPSLHLQATPRRRSAAHSWCATGALPAVPAPLTHGRGRARRGPVALLQPHPRGRPRHGDHVPQGRARQRRRQRERESAPAADDRHRGRGLRPRGRAPARLAGAHAPSQCCVVPAQKQWRRQCVYMLAAT
jgi:hypothetical protein